MKRIQRVHLVGIGGSGMSGIAEVLNNLGFIVTGSDLVKTTVTEHLVQLGITVFYQHLADNVADADVVVVSSAIYPDNVEVIAAKVRRITVVPRAEMLAELMRFKHGIAIAGSHGKTTTTSLIASLFAAADLDPTFVIGGKVTGFGAAKLGQGHYFIAEADESDASFVHLNPMISVITNIDNDHLEAYQGNLDNLRAVFLEFIYRLPFYGLVILCIDDEQIAQLVGKIARPFLTYGFSKLADIQAINWCQSEQQSKFDVLLPGSQESFSVEINLPGKHNVLNTLAAIAVAHEVGLTVTQIQAALKVFQGVSRRFQCLGEFQLPQKTFLFDDYGHHPVEIAAVLTAIKQGWPDYKLIMLYQPHRYTRTQALFTEFVQVLATIDQLLLLDVYAAGEEAIPGASSTDLAQQITDLGATAPLLVHESDNLCEKILPLLGAKNIILTQGAGYTIAKIAKALGQQFNNHSVTIAASVADIC